MNTRTALVSVALLTPSICGALPEDGYVSIINSEHWVVTSSETLPGEGNTAHLTHYNVLQKGERGRLEHRASFTGEEAADGGEHWQKFYRFTPAGKGLHVVEIDRNYTPIWALDPSGGLGTRRDNIRKLDWNGKAFAVTSSSTVSGLSDFKSENFLNVVINGEIFKEPEESLGSVKNKTAEMISWDETHLKVRLKDGRTVFVKPDVVKVPNAK